MYIFLFRSCPLGWNATKKYIQNLMVTSCKEFIPVKLSEKSNCAKRTDLLIKVFALDTIKTTKLWFDPRYQNEHHRLPQRNESYLFWYTLPYIKLRVCTPSKWQHIIYKQCESYQWQHNFVDEPSNQQNHSWIAKAPFKQSLRESDKFM